VEPFDVEKYGLSFDSYLQFFGGAGEAEADITNVNSAGLPYQTPFPMPGTGACPSKLSSGVTTWPPGCPGNAARLAWYILLINRILESQGSDQRISMINWDAEFNGPVNTQCVIFQFLSAYNYFRQHTTADWKTVTPMVPPAPNNEWTTWSFIQNGSSGLDNNAATIDGPKTNCGLWPQYVLTDASGNSFTMESVSTYKAAPEFYWFNGQDAGGGNPTLGPTGSYTTLLAPSLSDAGYQSCFQSSAEKPGFDLFCACRQTIYDTTAHLDDGDKYLLNVLTPDVFPGYLNPGTMPAFSIESQGTYDNSYQFSQCLNSRNFGSDTIPEPGKPDLHTLFGTKYTVPRCGVANFFGNWNESCFVSFLDRFVDSTKVKGVRPSVMVYDAGFLPQLWFQQLGITSSAGDVTTPQYKACAPDIIPPKVCLGMNLDFSTSSGINQCLETVNGTQSFVYDKCYVPPYIPTTMQYPVKQDQVQVAGSAAAKAKTDTFDEYVQHYMQRRRV
jgi:hypothetical protein